MTNLLKLFDEAQAALHTGAAPSLNAEGDPAGPCSVCGGLQFWKMPGKTWQCRTCHPMDSETRRTATTLTLPGAKPTNTVVALDEARIAAALKRACYGLPLTEGQLRAELQEAGDLPDVVSGALTPEALRQIAETLALMRVSRPKDSEDVE
jgi:hypothetical protein